MFTELLAPAGDFECLKQALYNGADAIYLATERFGARAYAKNLTIEGELQCRKEEYCQMRFFVRFVVVKRFL